MAVGRFLIQCRDAQYAHRNCGTGRAAGSVRRHRRVASCGRSVYVCSVTEAVGEPQDSSATTERPPLSVESPPSVMPPVWSEIMAYRANYGLGYFWTWVGLSHMSRRDRLAQLLCRPATRDLIEKLRGLDVAGLQQLQTLAEVNVGRAQFALRSTLVINVSSPVAVMVALGQLFPVEFKALIHRLDERQILTGLIIYVLVALFFTVAYAWTRARDAHELYEVIQLVYAHRRFERDR